MRSILLHVPYGHKIMVANKISTFKRQKQDKVYWTARVTNQIT